MNLKSACIRNLCLLLCVPSMASTAEVKNAMERPAAVEIWKADVNLPGEVPYSYYLELDRSPANVSGRIRMTWSWETIPSTPVTNGRFTIHVGPEAIPIRIEGEVKADSLQLTIFDPRTQPVSMTALRVPEIPRSLAKGSLPVLKKVQKPIFLRTPPMGWNSWNAFNDKVDDAAVRAMADVMVSSGLRDAGYRYVMVDDTWAANRGTDGKLHGNTKFPDMPALAAYLHARGLRFGLYSSPGPTTCGAYQGSYGHEREDAMTFASWGVDYLKYDWCSAGEVYADSQMHAAFQKMGQALAETNRQIVFAICQYGLEHVETWGQDAGGELWRISPDIADSWKSMRSNANAASMISNLAGPGRWNDPDLLQVGNGGMSPDEYRTHMSLWAILAAPYILTTDLRSISKSTLAMLSNPEVIAIDQDKGGKAGNKIGEANGLEIWKRDLADGSSAIAIVNPGDTPYRGDMAWKQMGLRALPLHAREIWNRSDIHIQAAGLPLTLPPHAVSLVRITPGR